MATAVPFGRLSYTSIVADSAAAPPWFTIVIATLTTWPSSGLAGFADTALGVRSGAGPVGVGWGRTSIVRDAVPSFPRASRTVTVARRAPTSAYAWIVVAGICSAVRVPSPKANRYETIRPRP